MSKKQVKAMEVLEMIKKNNFSVSSLAQKLSISRSSLYKKFKNDDLDKQTIENIGKIINHDFFEKYERTTNFVNKTCLCCKSGKACKVVLEEEGITFIIIK